MVATTGCCCSGRRHAACHNVCAVTRASAGLPVVLLFHGTCAACGASLCVQQVHQERVCRCRLGANSPTSMISTKWGVAGRLHSGGRPVPRCPSMHDNMS